MEIRVTGIEKILELTGVSTSFPFFNEIAQGVKDFLFFRQLAVKDLPSSFLDYLEQVEEFAITIQNELRRCNMTQFDKRKWNGVIDAIRNDSWKDLTPIQLMNAIWLRRLDKNVDDCKLTADVFLCKRKEEKKLFEMVVHLMYGYYENEVVNRTSNYHYP